MPKAGIATEAFNQEWSIYVAKGNSGRYGVCFRWDTANIDNITDWVSLPALTADIRNITPENSSFPPSVEILEILPIQGNVEE